MPHASPARRRHPAERGQSRASRPARGADVRAGSRYAGRMLRRNPGFTAVAVLALALGIGANTAIFSVVYAVVLKPLPYAHAEQLFNVFQAKPQDGVTGTGWSYLNYTELRDHNDVLSDTTGAQKHQLTLTGRGKPSVVDTSVVTAGFFSLFGEKALAGRTFNDDDGKRRGSGRDPQRGSLARVFRRRSSVIGRRSISTRSRSQSSGSCRRRSDSRRSRNRSSCGSRSPRIRCSAGGSISARATGCRLRVDGSRRHDGAGAGETGRDCRHPRVRLSGENGGWKIRMVLQQMSCQRQIAPALSPRRSRPRAAHRVREHRQPAAHARDVPGTGDRGSDNPRGGTGEDLRPLPSQAVVLGLLGGAVGSRLPTGASRRSAPCSRRRCPG